MNKDPIQLIHPISFIQKEIIIFCITTQRNVEKEQKEKSYQ